MFGLTYIRSLYNYSMQDIANILGINKHVIWEYEHRFAPIKVTHMEILSNTFKLPKLYLFKDLDEIDKIKLQVMKIGTEINKYRDYVDDGVIKLMEDIIYTHKMEKEIVERKAI